MNRIVLRWILFMFLLTTLRFHSLMAQEDSCPYPCKLDLRYDLPIASAGGLIGLTGFILDRKSIALNEERVLGFNRLNVNRFDRSAIGNSSDAAGTASDIFLYTSLFSPLALLGSKNVRASWKEFALMMGETYLITASLTILTKEIADRPRPFLYDPNVPLEDKIGSTQDNSFFSGHTSMVAMSSFFVASMFAYYHPDSKLKPLVWTFATTLPAVTGFLRYWDGKHFFTDIITGYAVGALTGTMIPLIHRKIQLKLESKRHTALAIIY